MTTAYILSIGNELLSGQTVDTNAAWLAGRLLSEGISTIGVSQVPDENERIIQSLKEVSDLADLILLTGGLGPTDDDLTRHALADFLGRPLEFREDLFGEIEAFFTRLGRTMAPRNRVQAYLPAGTDALANPLGTAPGIKFEQGGTFYAAMPGVPSEMKQMFTDHVLPAVRGKGGQQFVVIEKVRCFGPGESTLAEKLGDLMDRKRNPLINCTVSGGILTLHIVAKSPSRQEAQGLIEMDRNHLCGLLGDWVYGFNEDTLPEMLAAKLKQSNKTLVFAESCTGGLCSKLITDVPGSSEYFLGGWVTYSNEAKIRDLEVPKELIEQHGAVSEPVAEAMASGAARKSGADIAVAITGIAGPEGGTEQKPVGTVYISMWFNGKTQTTLWRYPSVSRQNIRLRTALTAINWVRSELNI